MSKVSQRVVERLGSAGLARVLDDLLDHTQLVRLANTCGVKYPGMRTQSQRRERLVSDLAGRAEANASAAEAIRRMLEKEALGALRDWNALEPAEKSERLSDERFLQQGKNLGLHLWLVAVDGSGLDDDATGAARETLLRLATDGGTQSATPPAASRDEARLKKKLAGLERKLRQTEALLGRVRESHKTIKRDLIQRKGELAESRMLAERLRAELAAARETARASAPEPRPTETVAEGGLAELEQSLRKLATEQRRLTRRLTKLPHEAPAAASDKALGPLNKTLAAVRDELTALRQEGAERHDAQQKRLAELAAALRAGAAVKRPRRQRVQGKGERVGVFVDVQNMYYAARKLKGRLDFDALMRAAVNERRLVRATAYVVESKETDQSQFIARLEKLALDVKRKTVQVRADGSMKGDWDMELALDILDMVPKLDVVVLVSGDGDFTSLVKRVKSAGPRVEVIAFPRHTAKSLVEAADEFQPLDRKFMIYPKRRKPQTDAEHAPAEPGAPHGEPETLAAASEAG